MYLLPKNIFFVSQLLKDYDKGSCPGASSVPIGDLDLSETETGNEEREYTMWYRICLAGPSTQMGGLSKISSFL